MKGRPTIFNNDDLIFQAQQLFWKKGYTATSMSDLLHITGAGSGSFYNTFKGGKKEIFRKSIEQRREAFENFKLALTLNDSPIELVKAFFRNVASGTADEHSRGCIIANTVVEMSNLDEALEQLAITILKEVETMFKDVIQEAQDRGEIANKTDAEILGRYLITFWCGFNTLRRMYPNKEMLLQQVEMQLAILN